MVSLGHNELKWNILSLQLVLGLNEGPWIKLCLTRLIKSIKVFILLICFSYNLKHQNPLALLFNHDDSLACLHSILIPSTFSFVFVYIMSIYIYIMVNKLHSVITHINSSPPGQNGRHFGRRHFQIHFLE